MAASQQATRRVVIGGLEHDKPWDPACGACRSPWMLSIDSMLAEGYSLRAIRKHLAGVRPAPPNEQILRSHIAHLAGPHRKARMAFEEAASARGDDTTTESARVSDALAALVRAGHEALTHGEMEVRAGDMIRAIQVQAQIDRAQAAEGVEATAWQTAFMEFIEIVRRTLTPAQWTGFVHEVYDSPVIRAALADSVPALAGGAPE